MKKGIKCLTALLLMVLILSGCAMTVEQMYRLPKRSERFDNLQTQIDLAMSGMEYCAPVSGENQQTVQMADLDGDGNSEVIVFAKGTDEDPMKVLLFTPVEDGYKLMAILDSTGTAFDQVEYVQMDGKPGLELIVGHQLSDKVLRNVTVYSFADGQSSMLMSAKYTKFLTCDLDEDGLSDLFVIRSGSQENNAAVAALYSVHNGELERSAEAELSAPAENLKRIITGELASGESGVYVASTAGEESIITDVFTLVDGVFTNVSFSNESGTSVKTLRNYYVYADDIDNDGAVELPYLITMKSPQGQETASQHLIRWYAMNADGSEVVKKHTYHNFLEGWYVELKQNLALKTCVVKDENGGYQFRRWDDSGEETTLLFTLYTLTGEERLAAAQEGDLLEVLKTETVVYAAKLETAAADWGIDADYLNKSFHLIQIDWKTGEM